MSALLVDDLIPASGEAVAWRHVPKARPQLRVLPGGASVAVAARPAASGVQLGSWQLTERGLAVLVGFFLALFATAAVVLVGGFLSVSNAPAPVAPVAVVAQS